MREIKYRAWDKSENQMARFVTELLFNSKGLYGVKLNHMGFEFMRRIKDVELMQYTGLKDKNGKEIYEGDILYHKLQGKRVVYYPFNEHVASYGLREISSGFCSTLQDSHRVYELIGNIHENPELLKGE